MNEKLSKAIRELTEHPAYGESVKKELVSFLTYLSASDGTIDSYESDFIREYLGVCMSPDEIRKYIAENNTYSREFELKVPPTLFRLVQADKERAAVEADVSSETRSDALAYVIVFEAAGKEFIVCDGKASEEEVNDLATYSEMLNRFLSKELGSLSGLKSAIDTDGLSAGENGPLFDANGRPVETLEELLGQLNELIGLAAVKKDVNSLIHLQEIKKLRRMRGLKEIPVSNHLVFYGNPGTGKTTVARLLAKIYHRMGILSVGQLVEVDRSGLVGGYVGQTALKTKSVIDTALGGVLFIDEAYALASDSENDYGAEAIDTLIKAMEDHRDDLVVIVAGYPELMNKFIDSNPGLKSRFNKHIYFADYSPCELMEIYRSMCRKAGYINTPETEKYVEYCLSEKYERRGNNFANAREVRNFFEHAVVRQADRLYGKADLTDEQICTFELSDVSDGALA